MKFRLLLLALLLLAGCTTKETKNYVTNNTGPADWQPPLLTWQAAPDAEVRGTVGLDVRVTDSSHVDSVLLFVDGLQTRMLHDTLYRFSLITDSLADGVHLCEARAFDHFGNLGISPVLRVNVMNSIAQGPRLLWVPDDFATIQAAINASEDFDTIRVRDGTYYETLNTFGKGIWIESEHGPLRCTIDDAGTNDVFYIEGNEVPCTIRGFHMSGISWLVYLWEAGQANICNNIFQSDTAEICIAALNAGGTISNNLFSGTDSHIQPAYFLGSIVNNMFLDAELVALYNSSYYGNPVTYGYNLFWDNTRDYSGFQVAATDVHGDPMIDLESGTLQTGSPAIDAGDPTIMDKNGTRSDIGPFGGPLAYTY
jgi:hypothetical protein